MTKLTTLYREPARIRKQIKITKADLLEVLQRGGLDIPKNTDFSIDDPGMRCGFEDAPPNEPLSITWIEYE